MEAISFKMIHCLMLPFLVDFQKEFNGEKKKALGMSNEELLAVVSHELGHGKLWHNNYNIIIMEFLGIMLVAFTRKMEFAPDRFSANLGLGKWSKSALIKLSRDNLIFSIDDWLYSA
ncbi:Peptidase M48 domain containing protein [Trichuris trichiura]|uniref:Peptidase M48 domain containing protein n=1 Tax=Trichuris trichiura TaxID=36087 RepID=A0A077Z5C3_TRITR|nr:Peptidase M48 domain containing protein [Trichuris trichiura]